MDDFPKNSFITFLAEIFILIFGLAISIITARILGPEGKGIYSLTILIPSLMLIFANPGLDSSNIYFLGSKRYKIQEIVSNSLSLALLIGLFLIIVFLGVSYFDFFKKFIHTNQISLPYMWMIVLIIPLYVLSNFFKNIIRGKGDILNYNKLGIFEGAVQLIAVIIFLLILKKSIFGAIIAYVLTIVFTSGFAVFLIKKMAKIRFSLNKKFLKESFTYGIQVYFANTISYLNYRLDMFLIALYLVPSAVGIYSITVGVAERLFIVPKALATVLFPKISSLNNIAANEFTPKIIRHTFFIMTISSLLLIFLAAPMIKTLFGEGFLPAVTPLIILLPGIIAFGISGVLAADLAGRGKPRFAVYASFAALIVNISFNIIFIPRWGISGSAFASTVAYVVDTFIILTAFLMISRKSLIDVLVIKKEDFEDYFHLFLRLKNWIWTKVILSSK